MSNTAQSAIQVARSKRGVGESPPKSNDNEFTKWYGVKRTPWCAIFLSWVVDRIGNKEYRFASTMASVASFRRQGKLHSSVSNVKPGDIVVERKSATKGHTGLVVANEGNTIVTLEGNCSDKVMEMRRKRSHWTYGLDMKYDGSGTQPRPQPQPQPQPGQLVVDGQFGPQTIRVLQQQLNDTGANPRLAVDGEFGPSSKRALQARLNHVAGPVNIDGSIDPQTIRALQRHVGAPVDGQWGSQTNRKLQEALNARRF